MQRARLVSRVSLTSKSVRCTSQSTDQQFFCFGITTSIWWNLHNRALWLCVDVWGDDYAGECSYKLLYVVYTRSADPDGNTSFIWLFRSAFLFCYIIDLYYRHHPGKGAWIWWVLTASANQLMPIIFSNHVLQWNWCIIEKICSFWPHS